MWARVCNPAAIASIRTREAVSAEVVDPARREASVRTPLRADPWWSGDARAAIAAQCDHGLEWAPEHPFETMIALIQGCATAVTTTLSR